VCVLGTSCQVTFVCGAWAVVGVGMVGVGLVGWWGNVLGASRTEAAGLGRAVFPHVAKCAGLWLNPFPPACVRSGVAQ
jgi:hypothetical protein